MLWNKLSFDINRVKDIIRFKEQEFELLIIRMLSGLPKVFISRSINHNPTMQTF